MDKTIRHVVGYKVSKNGDCADLLLETADGTRVALAVMPEAIIEIVLNLMNARTEAFARAEGPVRSEATAAGTHRRQPIPGEKLYVAEHHDPSRSVIQIMTPGGGVFEFDLPDSGLPWKRPA